MSSIGITGIYKAPKLVGGHPAVLARVGPETENAALVVGVRGDLVTLRVFPAAGQDFTLPDIGADVENPMGSFSLSDVVTPATRAEGGTRHETQHTQGRQR